ncbi:hypothetical protein KBC79_05390 [Candidatus Woesebacteria bacterium]|nr:hypothetical protein [Candidatus Woesebacteria bacterium]
MYTSRITFLHSALFFVSFFIFAVSLQVQTAHAQKTTPSPTPEVSSAPNTVDEKNETSKETIDEIKRRIEKNTEAVKGVTDSVEEKVGLVGEVIRITGESLTLKTQSATIIMALPQETLVKSGAKTLKLTEIAVGNWAAIIGTETDDTFTPDTILISTENLRPKPQVVTLGTIAEIEKSEITLTPRGNSQENKTLTVTKNTSFEDSDGTAAKLADFETDASVLVVANEGEDDEITLLTIRSLAPLEK